MSFVNRDARIDMLREARKHVGWIGFDLDGTLARYDEWQGADHVGAPIPLMVERLKRYYRMGYEVRIVTARVSPAGSRSDCEASRAAIERWCLEHLGFTVPVTCEKDYGMLVLFDDRAVQVERNTGVIQGKEPVLY